MAKEMNWLNLALVHSGTPIAKQMTIMHTFQAENKNHKKLSDYKNPDLAQPYALVSTINLIGVGFTCNGAFHMVLLESGFVKDDEIRAKGHMHQIRQKNSHMYTYRLYSEGVIAEETVAQFIFP